MRGSLRPHARFPALWVGGPPVGSNRIWGVWRRGESYLRARPGSLVGQPRPGLRPKGVRGEKRRLCDVIGGVAEAVGVVSDCVAWLVFVRWAWPGVVGGRGSSGGRGLWRRPAGPQQELAGISGPGWVCVAISCNWLDCDTFQLCPPGYDTHTHTCRQPESCYSTQMDSDER